VADVEKDGMTDGRAHEVLAFWFGADGAPRDAWFRKDDDFDAEIRTRFGALIESALERGIDGWGGDRETALARLIVLDQFTRNAFRDTPQAFAGDALALAGTRDLVARGEDRRLPPLRRIFVYLPLEHAEDAAAQEESLRLFGLLAREAPELAAFEDWARRHADVIARFGRYPHRNALLGRASTDEELRFLAQAGSRF
jgi:uncharacterized protein (DUF924 family)